MNQELDKFDVLEEKITKLVEAYSTLQDEKTSLGEELAQKDLEIQKLKDKISHLSHEREIAREKVEGLLNRVERLISTPAGIGIGKG
jgi:chromosome segregation ATPase